MSMMYREIGQLIRKFRTSVNGKGISQEALAQEIGTNSNTVSRWETAVYKPTMDDLEKLATFFRVPMTFLLPQPGADPRVVAILSAIHDMADGDIEEVIRFAQFRRVTAPIRLQVSSAPSIRQDRPKRKQANKLRA
jgi:transcriptional regulator with XRE-family HTH domain